MEYTDALRKSQEFQRVYRQGSSVSDKYLVLYVRRNEGERNRLGISVSRKVGNSVVRHRVKRLIKENYRLKENSICQGIDLVVIARAQGAEADFYQIRDSLLKLAKRQKILKNV